MRTKETIKLTPNHEDKMTTQKQFQVMHINGPVFGNAPIVRAKSSSDAVYKAFGKHAVRSGEFTLDYCATNLATGRKTFLKKIK